MAEFLSVVHLPSLPIILSHVWATRYVLQAGKGLVTQPFPLNTQVLVDKNVEQLVAEAVVASVHTYALQFADTGVVSIQLPSNPILVEHPSVVK